jgi:hypothetical protein
MSILESFLAGKEARRVADAQEQINAMQAFVGQNGQAIMAGDQNALAHLAGFGVQGLQTAMDIQGNVEAREDRASNRDRNKVVDARADQEFQLKLDAHKRSLTAEQAAAEAAAYANAATIAASAQTPEDWDRLATENGAPELVGQFGKKDEIIWKLKTASERLAALEGPAGPEWRPATPEEAAANGAVAGQVNTVTGKFDAQNPPSGMALTTNPDGTMTLEQGPGVTGAGRTGKPTEGSLASEGYLQRMQKAEEIFKGLEEAGTTALGWTDRPAVNTDAESWKLTEPEQMLLQAQRDWVRAKLRKESGAVIGPDEMAAEIRQYFPQPGEGPRVIAQKKASRKAAEEQLRITALLPETAPNAAAPDAPATGGNKTSTGVEWSIAE